MPDLATEAFEHVDETRHNVELHEEGLWCRLDCSWVDPNFTPIVTLEVD